MSWNASFPIWKKSGFKWWGGIFLRKEFNGVAFWEAVLIASTLFVASAALVGAWDLGPWAEPGGGAVWVPRVLRPKPDDPRRPALAVVFSAVAFACGCLLFHWWEEKKGWKGPSYLPFLGEAAAPWIPASIRPALRIFFRVFM